jgi:hypothetical protein
VPGQDLRFVARPDGEARAEMSATMRAEYVEAFSRYFAEATLDDPKAAGVRALIPGFHRPPGTCTRRRCRTRSPPGPGRGDQRAAEAVEDSPAVPRVRPRAQPGLQRAHRRHPSGRHRASSARCGVHERVGCGPGTRTRPRRATSAAASPRPTRWRRRGAVNLVRTKLWRGRGRDLLGPVAYLDVDGSIVPTTGSHKQGSLCGRAPI